MIISGLIISAPALEGTAEMAEGNRGCWLMGEPPSVPVASVARSEKKSALGHLPFTICHFPNHTGEGGARIQTER